MMKKFLFIIFVMLVCLQVSEAQKVESKSNKKTEQLQDNSDARKKAYEEMQKAKAEYLKEVEKYKKECQEYEDRVAEENSANIVINENNLSDMLSKINIDINYDEIEKNLGKAWDNVLESIDCTDEESQTKNFNLKDFSAIQCEGIAQIIFTQDSKYNVKAVGGKSLVENLDIKVENGTLFISMSKSSKIKLNNKRKINLEVYVSAPNLKSVKLGGISTFSAKELKGDTFTITTEGISKITCPSLKFNKLTSKVSGASSLNMKFKGETADIDNSGASKYVMDVDCTNLVVRNSGAGTMKISGTADKTDIKSSGVSRVNISELNKY